MAGLPWIRVHSDLPQHPKSIRLGIKLADPRAWSYVVQLWLWAAQHAPEGRVEGPDSDAVLAHACGWPHEPEKIVRALHESGFIDQTGEGFQIHNWDVHALPHIEKREKDRDRMRRLRERSANGSRTVREQSANVAGEREREREKKPLSQDVRPLVALIHALEAGGWVADAPRKEGGRSAVDEVVRRDGVDACARRLLYMVGRERAAGREPPPGLGWHMDTLNGAPIRAAAKKPNPLAAQPPATDFSGGF